MWFPVTGAVAALIIVVFALRLVSRRSVPLETLKEKYRLPGSKFVSLGGHETHVVDEGHGPALILLHGNASSLWLWNHWAEVFVAAGYRVIRFDLPPYGLSSYSPGQSYGVVASHQVLTELMDARGIDSAVLIGIANGGPPAAWYATTHPGRVSGLVLINTPFYPPEHHTDALKLQQWARRHVYPYLGRPWLADWLYVRELAGKKQPVQRRFVSHIHDLARRQDIPDPLDVYGSSFEFRSDRWNPLRMSNAQMLAKLQIPTLLLWSGAGLLPKSEATRLARHMVCAPEPGVQVVEAAGHWLPLHRPGEIAGCVVAYLSTVAGHEPSSADSKD
jgi:pimeloyl-ACP methyl ester carboxylesterase